MRLKELVGVLVSVLLPLRRRSVPECLEFLHQLASLSDVNVFKLSVSRLQVIANGHLRLSDPSLGSFARLLLYSSQIMLVITALLVLLHGLKVILDYMTWDGWLLLGALDRGDTVKVDAVGVGICNLHILATIALTNFELFLSPILVVARNDLRPSTAVVIILTLVNQLLAQVSAAALLFGLSDLVDALIPNVLATIVHEGCLDDR